MICRFCHQEMEEDQRFCPACGGDNAPEREAESVAETGDPAAEKMPESTQGEPTYAAGDAAGRAETQNAAEAPAGCLPDEAKKRPLNRKKLAVTAVAAVLALALIAGAVFAAIRVPAYLKEQKELQKNPGAKASYTEEDDTLAKQLDKVVAVMGDRKLDNGHLQIFYWMEFYNFTQQYGSYASAVGLNLYAPLDEQTCPLREEEMTWQQYFLEAAIGSWSRYQALALEAEAAGFTLDQEYEDRLASMPEDLEETAKERGYASAEELVRHDFGANATVQAYVDYLRLYYTGFLYFAGEYAKLSPTDQEISDYYDANAESYEAEGVLKVDKNVVDVRHILISPPDDEDTPTDENGRKIYTEDQLAEARKEAEALYAQWLAGETTEDSFAALAMEKSTDPGSQSNGGLYSEIAPGQMVEAWNDWAFADGRKPGDTGIVDTSFGSHIMYFVGTGDYIYWQKTAQEDYLQQLSGDMVEAVLAAHPYEPNYKNAALGSVTFTEES